MVPVHEPNDDYAGIDWIARDADGRVQRRTIVQGAAWTIPVVALATATPAAAASQQPTLAFTQGSYSGTACSTIDGVQVKRTVGDAPSAGEAVSVTLADGYTFSDGGTTFTGTTDASGLLTLPSIKVPARGGNSSFGASSGSLTAAAPVTAAAAGSVYQYMSGRGSNGPVGGVSTTVGENFVLTADGGLYDINAGLVSTGVSSASGFTTIDGNHWVTYVTGNGVYQYMTGRGSTGPLGGVSTAVGDNFVLTADGGLYDINAGLVATGVSSASGFMGADGTHWVTYVTSGGVYQYRTGRGSTGPHGGVSTAVGDNFVLTGDGGLYDINGGLVATGVTSASGFVNLANGDHFVTYVTNEGVFQYMSGRGSNRVWGIPAGSTAVGENFVLGPDGTLYDINAGVVSTGVTSASGFVNSNGDHFVTYVAANC